MAVARAGTRPRYYLILVVLTAITFIAVDNGSRNSVFDKVRSVSRDAFAPLSDAANGALRPVTNTLSAIFHYGDLKSQNQRLREQVQSLQGNKLTNDQLQRELDVIGGLDHLTFAQDVPSVMARVTSSSTANFESSIQINKGTDDGIAKGMPVVSGSGLVGRIVEASRTRATIALIADSSVSVGVRIVRTGDIGIAEGTGQNHDLHVDGVATDADTQVGDAIVTSGLQNSVYPPDVPIGLISAAPRPHAGDLQRTFSVHPAVDFDSLSYVKVLQWSPNKG